MLKLTLEALKAQFPNVKPSDLESIIGASEGEDDYSILNSAYILRHTPETLKSKFPNTKPVYLKAIAQGLDIADYDVLDGVKNMPEYLEGRRRLAAANLSNYDQPYEFKTYHQEVSEQYAGKDKINFVALNNCVDELLGKYGGKKGKKFIIGGLAHQYYRLIEHIKKNDETIMQLETLKSKFPNIEQIYLDAVVLLAEDIKKNDETNLNLDVLKTQFPNIEQTNLITVVGGLDKEKFDILKDYIFEKRKTFAKELYKDNYPLIDSVRKGTASINEAQKLVGILKEKLELRNNASKKINEASEAIPFGGLLPGDVKVEVWKRDPSKDMSYYDEFNCCAFLGAKDGNIYAPKYLRNGTVSMVDFSMNIDGEETRLVRAITSACAQRRNKRLTGKTYMLVDSIEGSDQIKPEIIFDALTDYAKHSGFDGILFFQKPGNPIPQYFVTHLKSSKKSKGFKDKKTKLQLLYSNRHEFIEGLSEDGVIGKIRGYVTHFSEYDKSNETQLGKFHDD